MPRLGAVYAKVRDPHPVVFDVLLVGCVAVIGVITELVHNPQVPDAYREGNAFSVGLVLAAAVPLVWRRRYPAAVMAVAVVVIAVHSFHLFPGAGPFLAALVAAYSVAAYGSERAARISLVIVLAAQPTALVWSDDPEFDSWGDVAVGLLVFTAVWVWGDSRRMRRLHLEMVEERARRAEHERDEQARAAVREERARIARDMHDIVAHSVSVMVVQAGAARRMVGHDPVAAVEATGQIEATGREALREMRRVLGVLRADEAERAGEDAPEPLPPSPVPVAEPQPRLSDLSRLVGQCRDAGLDVRVRVDGGARPLPSGIELAAYRIVQEALTNTMKHAGPARAEVRVTYADDALTVAVADDGGGAGFDPGRGGHGLPGMRERVAAYGGSLEAGSHPGGGFRVRARLPLDGAPEAAAPAPTAVTGAPAGAADR
jgi:signal transduction histidine kinase